MMMKKKMALDLNSIKMNNSSSRIKLSMQTADSSKLTDFNTKDIQSLRPLTSRNIRKPPIKVQLKQFNYNCNFIDKRKTIPYFKKLQKTFTLENTIEKKIEAKPYSRNNKKVSSINTRNYSLCDFNQFSEIKINNTVNNTNLSKMHLKSMFDSPIKSNESNDKNRIKIKINNKLKQNYIFKK